MGKSQERASNTHQNSDPELLDCDVCHNYSTTDRKDLDQHQLDHYGPKKFQCHECEYFLCRTEAQFDDHMRQHRMGAIRRRNQRKNRFRSILGIYCGKPVWRSRGYLAESEARLESHRRVHRTYRCDECGYPAEFEERLESHRRRFHKTYPCDECGYPAESEEYLEKHRIVHDSTRPYECEKCDYKTYFKAEINDHMKSHAEDSKFRCAYGDYATNNVEALKVHLRRSGHYAEEEYQEKIVHLSQTKKENIQVIDMETEKEVIEVDVVEMETRKEVQEIEDDEVQEIEETDDEVQEIEEADDEVQILEPKKIELIEID